MRTARVNPSAGLGLGLTHTSRPILPFTPPVHTSRPPYLKTITSLRFQRCWVKSYRVNPIFLFSPRLIHVAQVPERASTTSFVEVNPIVSSTQRCVYSYYNKYYTHRSRETSPPASTPPRRHPRRYRDGAVPASQPLQTCPARTGTFG